MASAADLGLTGKAVHEARLIRDAEEADPNLFAESANISVHALEQIAKAEPDIQKRTMVRIRAPVGKCRTCAAFTNRW